MTPELITYVDSILVGPPKCDCGNEDCKPRHTILTDAQIIPRLVDFYHGLDPIVDLTFGKGRFWSVHRPDSLIGMDLAAGAHYGGGEMGEELIAKGDVRGDFRNLPFKDGSVGTIIYDPPHLKRRNSDGASVYALLYNLNSWDGRFDHVASEIHRVLKDKGLVIAKLADELSRGRLNDARFYQALYDVGFRWFDRPMKYRQLSIRKPDQQQWRARKRHSWYLVAMKGRRCNQPLNLREDWLLEGA